MESKLKEVLAKWCSNNSWYPNNSTISENQSNSMPPFHVESIEDDYVGYVEERINDELEEGYRQQAETMNEIYTGKVLKK